MSDPKIWEQAIQVLDKERRINRHVEDAGHQREPRLLESPAGPQSTAHPDVESALFRQRAGQLANHEGRD